MKQLDTRISRNEKVAHDFYKMRLESPYLARTIKPGQFIEIRSSDSSEPLLRRPFSVHRILKNGIEILYEVLGRGTTALSQRKAGKYLDIIGPLGNGFDIRLTAYNLPLTAILIAGGMGVAPLVALAEKLVHSPWSIVHGKKKIYALLGAATKDRIICERDFKKIDIEVVISTEDGSKGKKGLVTEVLTSLLSTIDYGPSTIYACGPNAMLEEVARIAGLLRIPCQVSLEEYMACGVGVCLGCPVKVRSKTVGYEYKMVCKDGPVFDAKEIAW